jgi:two-component system, chemotaxis family, chemotaxis protein CheY
MPRLDVVICDDSTDIRELVRIVVEQDGNRVVGEAANGREAIAKAEERQPDVVLLDLSMPVMDGLEALPEIQRVAPAARVVIRGLVALALDLGAESFVTKGGDPSEILAAVAGRAAAS